MSDKTERQLERKILRKLTKKVIQLMGLQKVISERCLKLNQKMKTEMTM